MNKSKINKAIAEYCGWLDVRICTLHSPPLTLGEKPIKGGYLVDQRVPNYCRDLNAMHEAENKLSNTWVYKVELERLTNGNEWHATAQQKTEAFLKTIGKWK